MTVLVGVLCNNGVVIGTDSAASFATGSRPTIEQPCKKISIIEDSVIVAGTGQVGLDQRFYEVIKNAWTEKIFIKAPSPIEICKELSRRGTQDFGYTSAPKNSYGSLVAFSSNGKHYLCEFSVNDFQPELKTDNIWYVSMGCGQSIADPFLGFMRKVFWSSGPPSIQDAVFTVAWTLDLAIELNTGGINGPMQISILSKNESGKYVASLLSDDKLQEHKSNIDRACEYLGKYPELLRRVGEEVPAPPVPTAIPAKPQ